MYLNPIGQDSEGNDVFLKDIWASLDEVKEYFSEAFDPNTYRRLYSDFADKNPLWNAIESSSGQVYEWDRDSTYIQEPPYFDEFSMETGRFSNFYDARPLAIFGDSVTTDHISPAGAIKANSPAGIYLQELGVEPQDFNSYGHAAETTGLCYEERSPMSGSRIRWSRLWKADLPRSSRTGTKCRSTMRR